MYLKKKKKKKNSVKFDQLLPTLNKCEQKKKKKNENENSLDQNVWLYVKALSESSIKVTFMQTPATALLKVLARRLLNDKTNKNSDYKKMPQVKHWVFHMNHFPEDQYV